MSLWHIAWSYIWSRKLPTFVTIACVSLGVALISAVLTLRQETQRRFEEEGQAWDIVVGAKGSPLQLVLSSVYFMDVPTGNITYGDYETIKAHEDVEAAYPLGMGDTFRGFRIVGTEVCLFSYSKQSSYGEPIAPFHFAEGRAFEAPMEAVLGAFVARETGLGVGDTFTGTHGFVEGFGHEHAEQPYTVVGILEPSSTPFDRVVLTPLESVWNVHGEHHEADEADHAEGGEHAHVEGEEHAHVEGEEHAHDGHSEGEEHHDAEERLEVTAVLVSLKSAGVRFSFREYVNDGMNAMAVIPVNQIASLYNQLLGTIKMILLAVGYLVVAVSALSILASLYLSIMQRRRDLAVMRALGASTVDIFGVVLLEAFWVTLLGIAGGWFLGKAVTWCIGQYLGQRFGMYITAFGVSTGEFSAFAAVALMGLLAGLVPAWQAYRTDVARHLAEH